MRELWSTFAAVSGVAWFIVKAIMAGVAFARLRTTVAGWLLGGSLALSALKSISRVIEQQVLASRVSPLEPLSVGIFVVLSTLSFLCLLGIAAGILMIPSSLDQLRQSGVVHGS